MWSYGFTCAWYIQCKCTWLGAGGSRLPLSPHRNIMHTLGYSPAANSSLHFQQNHIFFVWHCLKSTILIFCAECSWLAFFLITERPPRSEAPIVEVWLTAGLKHPHFCWVCGDAAQMFLQTEQGLCGNRRCPGLGSPSTPDPPPLAPTGLIRRADARSALRGQHYLSDLSQRCGTRLLAGIVRIGRC